MKLFYLIFTIFSQFMGLWTVIYYCYLLGSLGRQEVEAFRDVGIIKLFLLPGILYYVGSAVLFLMATGFIFIFIRMWPAIYLIERWPI